MLVAIYFILVTIYFILLAIYLCYWLYILLCICSEPPLVENIIRVSVQCFADSCESIDSMLAG